MFPLGQEEPSTAHICQPLQPSLPLNSSPATKQLCDPGASGAQRESFFPVEFGGSEGSVVCKASIAKSAGIGQGYHCRHHPNHGLGAQDLLNSVREWHTSVFSVTSVFDEHLLCAPGVCTGNGDPQRPRAVHLLCGGDSPLAGLDFPSCLLSAGWSYRTAPLSQAHGTKLHSSNHN